MGIHVTEMTMYMRGVFVSCLSLGLALSVAASGKDAGFEGKWELDKSRSTATCDIPDGLEQQVKVKDGEMRIQSRWKEPKNGIAPLVLLGVMTTDLRLKTDGSQSNTQIGPFQAVTTTKQDGGALKTDWQTVVNGDSVSGQWIRSIAADGRQMTLDIQQKASDGKSGNAKLVFKRR